MKSSSLRQKFSGLCLLLLLIFALAPQLAQAQKSPATDVAKRIDASLAAELGAAADKTPLADDETFLRRVTLDLIGDLPTPEEVIAFVLDSSPNKRAMAVDRLLADKRYGENWGNYFRDVILYRRSDERALLAGPTIQKYFADQFNGGAGWDAIARDFITARGDVREAGNTGVIMAQMGQPPEVAAEMARIFLGIQIQCAQCHDHPTDRWKRSQFHELVAFFPRLTVRPVRDGEKRSFAVVSQDAQPRKAPKDGKYRGSPEHFMPDLNDPSAKGTEMTPVFFLTGKKLELGTPDVKRRSTLADWFTAKGNPWFAKAFVNRIWFEMVGSGFYEPIDDLGPDREATAPKTLDILAIAFANHDYDVKWLMRAIAATNAYQHESVSRGTASSSPFAANIPQPLRADQIYDALTTALGVDDFDSAKPERIKGYRGGQQGARGEFNRTFGFDPSLPRDEVAASIPQALVLMNSPILQRAISANAGSTLLGRLSSEKLNDDEIVAELYLRCLAREPKPDELHACVSHISTNKNRSEALEDVLWALLNSTEFSQRK